MQKNRRKLIATSLAGMLCAGLTGVPGAIADTLVLEEIIVTAQKREQSFNDIGIAVTALGADDIAELRLAQPVDMAAQMPNVRINNVIANTIPNITIRGIGLNDYATNNNPAAGVYVDEVYLVSPAMLSFQMLDLARVEVLKGPQGTLYGRNTTAGAVNFVANKPTDEFTAGLALDYGRFDHVAARAHVSGPLSETLSARLAVQTTQQGEGHQSNRLTGDDVGEIDTTAWRGLLQWQPTETLDVLLNVHGGEDTSDVHLIKIDNPFSAEDDGDDYIYRSGASVDTRQDIESLGGALTVNWSLSDRLTVTSITGYEELDRFHVEDRDATSLVQLDGVFINSVEQASQELRVSYMDESRVAILGAYYGSDEVSTRDRFDSTDLLPLLGLSGFQSLGNEYRQETDSLALFAHGEWQLSPAWRLTAGLRYTDEEKDFGEAFTYLITGGTEIPVFPATGNSYTVDDLSGKLGIDYTGIDDLLLYASVSNGFKAGGFQGQLTFNPADLQAFQEEDLWAYEAGAKMTLAGGALQVNASAFFYDYSDMQFYGGLFDSPVGTLFGIDNVGDSEVMGAELELFWRPAIGLDVRLGAGWLDTEITDSVVAGVAEGSELPNSPEFNLNGIVRYEWSLTSDLLADAVFDFNYQDEMTFDIVRAPAEARESSYWLFNARAGIGSADGGWSTHVWARNLANKEYRTQVLFSSVGFGESWGLPRRYGVTVNFAW